MVLLGVLSLCLFSGGAPAQAATSEIATLGELQAKIVSMQASLERLQTALAEAQLTVALASVNEADEGFVTVVINDAMRFPCADKVATDGEWCVRHYSSDLGESYVDLSYINGFMYDESEMYDVTLVRTRAASYGQTDASQYEFTLLRDNLSS